MRASVVDLVTSSAGMSWSVSCALEAGVLLAASWLGAMLLRRSSAAARHHMWTLGVVGALLLPALCWVMPSALPSRFEAPVSAITSAGSVHLDAPAMVAPDAPPTWPTWLALVWATGAAVVGLRVIRSHLAARSLARAAGMEVPARWTTALADAARALALTRHVELRRSDVIGSPMTIGTWRPRVIMPANADSWSVERVRATFVHELGHVRRRDTLVQLLAQLACALYWWNPLAWHAAARLRIEREHACDDLVLDAGTVPSSYASDLLEVARAVSTRARAAAACMVERSPLDVRLQRILDATTARTPVRMRFRGLTSALTLACAAVFACTSPAPQLPSSRGTLTMGTPSVRESDPTDLLVIRDLAARREGTADLAAVASEVTRRLGDLDQCYQRRLASNPALSGTVTVHWVIEPSGHVPDACITNDTVHDRELVACVNRLVLAGGDFPGAVDGPVDVELPFVFTARATVATSAPSAPTR